MVVTVHTEDGQAFTQTRRITDVGTDFERLHKLNALSRRICSQKLTIEEIQAELRSIDSAKTYPQWLICLCYSMIAGSFALFFGGGLADAGVALLAGLAVGLTALICDRTVKNKIFTKFTASLITTAIAFGAFKLGWISSLDKVLIGNIMSLIPGMKWSKTEKRSYEPLLICLLIRCFFITSYIKVSDRLPDPRIPGI